MRLFRTPGAAIAVLATVMAGTAIAGAQNEAGGAHPLLARVDHLVYAAPDLQAGIDRVEQLLGVRASPGGQHPGRGTRNALVALGPGAYLEIIGPDPEQPTPAQPRPFRIDALAAPELVAWAAKTNDPAIVAQGAAQQGIRLGPVIAGSRRRTDGVMLAWRYTDPRTVVADGLVPFFIDWGSTPHPSATAAPGATLAGFRGQHPEATRVRQMLSALGIPLEVQEGPRPVLIATITGPRGRVELR